MGKNTAPEKNTSAYEIYCKITEYVFKFVNSICVLSLFIELVSVIIMVVGRYVFNKVPLWSDQLSLMALIWMSLLSIPLALYTETHLRVELIDNLLSKKKIDILKHFSNVLIFAFSIWMIFGGEKLVGITKKMKLSGFHVSQSLMYIPLILCGITSAYMCVFCIVRRIKEANYDE